ncbi:hypothetical protein NDU88_002022 [Pleurodeles waltl]|uniref:Uncharacterized protein n=1 Tax=Pleurodeles waltl TaxID=8319 RepID=A0AAV7MQE5_PLEWA|nr:hypothetical protein NDU88_002022 [Pleurodeles waltl]
MKINGRLDARKYQDASCPVGRTTTLSDARVRLRTSSKMAGFSVAGARNAQNGRLTDNYFLLDWLKPNG